jgi:hypothetical protein
MPTPNQLRDATLSVLLDRRDALQDARMVVQCHEPDVGR